MDQAAKAVFLSGSLLYDRVDFDFVGKAHACACWACSRYSSEPSSHE